MIVVNRIEDEVIAAIDARRARALRPRGIVRELVREVRAAHERSGGPRRRVVDVIDPRRPGGRRR